MNLGLCLEKEGFRAALVDGTLGAPTLSWRSRYKNPSIGDPALTSDWFHSRVGDILSSRGPKRVICKIHFDLSSVESVLIHGLPLGVIALCAHSSQVDLSLITKAKLKSAKTFGLAKGESTYAAVESLNDGKPLWNEATKDAILAAWSGLE